MVPNLRGPGLGREDRRHKDLQVEHAIGDDAVAFVVPARASRWIVPEGRRGSLKYAGKSQSCMVFVPVFEGARSADVGGAEQLAVLEEHDEEDEEVIVHLMPPTAQHTYQPSTMHHACLRFTYCRINTLRAMAYNTESGGRELTNAKTKFLRMREFWCCDSVRQFSQSVRRSAIRSYLHITPQSCICALIQM